MNTYKVKSTLKHNDTVYNKGDKVDLNEKEAKQLLSDKVVSEVGADEDEETPTQPAVNNVEREGEDTEGDQKVEEGDATEETEEETKEEEKEEEQL